jgi:hypothetical protein
MNNLTQDHFKNLIKELPSAIYAKNMGPKKTLRSFFLLFDICLIIKRIQKRIIKTGKISSSKNKINMFLTIRIQKDSMNNSKDNLLEIIRSGDIEDEEYLEELLEEIFSYGDKDIYEIACEAILCGNHKILECVLSKKEFQADTSIMKKCLEEYVNGNDDDDDEKFINGPIMENLIMKYDNNWLKKLNKKNKGAPAKINRSGSSRNTRRR